MFAQPMLTIDLQVGHGCYLDGGPVPHEQQQMIDQTVPSMEGV